MPRTRKTQSFTFPDGHELPSAAGTMVWWVKVDGTQTWTFLHQTWTEELETAIAEGRNEATVWHTYWRGLTTSTSSR